MARQGVTTGIFKSPTERSHSSAQTQSRRRSPGGPDSPRRRTQSRLLLPRRALRVLEKKTCRTAICRSASFGENFTTEGLLEEDVHLGDRFAINDAEVIVTQPRLPCYKLGVRFQVGRHGEEISRKPPHRFLCCCHSRRRSRCRRRNRFPSAQQRQRRIDRRFPAPISSPNNSPRPDAASIQQLFDAAFGARRLEVTTSTTACNPPTPSFWSARLWVVVLTALPAEQPPASQ